MTLLAFASLTTAHAAIPTAGPTVPAQQINNVINAFSTQTNVWFAGLQGYAFKLFIALATIEVAWTLYKTVMGGADAAAILIELIQQGVTIGFFAWVIEYYNNFANDIITGLRDAAANVGGVRTLSPGNILTAGFNLMLKMLNHLTWNLPTDIAMVLAGIVVLIVFALITAQIALVLIESYFAINMGVLFLACGPARWTNSYAIGVIRYVISVGAKLFVLQLALGIGQSMLMSYATEGGTGNPSTIFVIAATAIVLLAVVEKVPAYAQGLINGGGGADGRGLGAAAAAVGAGLAGIGMAAYGGGSAINEAAQLASATGGGTDAAGASGGAGGGAGGTIGAAVSGGASESGNSGGGMGRGQLMARTAGILGKAAYNDMRDRVEGAPGARSGTMGGRMARQIRSQNESRSGVPSLTPDPPT